MAGRPIAGRPVADGASERHTPAMALLPELLAAYRRSGADLPFGDPRLAHGVGMEGYYWRITDPAAGRVVIALCGLCSAPRGSWALVALAAHPEGVARHAIVPEASGAFDALGIRAGDVLHGTVQRLAVDLGPGARLDVSFADRRPWPRRMFGGLGLAQAIPGLGQYWHPHELGARVSGTAELGPVRVSLDGATAYAEKNWGSAFARHWWWGQAHGFPDPDVCVAFAGGGVRLPVGLVAPTAVVVRLGDRVLRLVPPLARTVAAVGADAWRVHARQGRVTISIEGAAGAHATPAHLPVPLPHEYRAELRSRQLLAGGIHLEVTRSGRRLYAGSSRLAGLERDL